MNLVHEISIMIKVWPYCRSQKLFNLFMHLCILWNKKSYGVTPKPGSIKEIMLYKKNKVNYTFSLLLFSYAIKVNTSYFFFLFKKLTCERTKNYMKATWKINISLLFIKNHCSVRKVIALSLFYCKIRLKSIPQLYLFIYFRNISPVSYFLNLKLYLYFRVNIQVCDLVYKLKTVSGWDDMASFCIPRQWGTLYKPK